MWRRLPWGSGATHVCRITVGDGKRLIDTIDSVALAFGGRVHDMFVTLYHHTRQLTDVVECTHQCLPVHHGVS